MKQAPQDQKSEHRESPPQQHQQADLGDHGADAHRPVKQRYHLRPGGDLLRLQKAEPAIRVGVRQEVIDVAIGRPIHAQLVQPRHPVMCSDQTQADKQPVVAMLAGGECVQPQRREKQQQQTHRHRSLRPGPVTDGLKELPAYGSQQQHKRQDEKRPPGDQHGQQHQRHPVDQVGLVKVVIVGIAGKTPRQHRRQQQYPGPHRATQLHATPTLPNRAPRQQQPEQNQQCNHRTRRCREHLLRQLDHQQRPLIAAHRQVSDRHHPVVQQQEQRDQRDRVGGHADDRPALAILLHRPLQPLQPASRQCATGHQCGPQRWWCINLHPPSPAAKRPRPHRTQTSQRRTHAPSPR